MSKTRMQRKIREKKGEQEKAEHVSCGESVLPYQF